MSVSVHAEMSTRRTTEAEIVAPVLIVSNLPLQHLVAC